MSQALVGKLVANRYRGAAELGRRTLPGSLFRPSSASVGWRLQAATRYTFQAAERHRSD